MIHLRSSVFAANALRGAAASAASATTKRKDVSSNSDFRGEKKKKSALEQIIEVEKTI